MKKILFVLASISLFAACKKTELPLSQTAEEAVEFRARPGGGGGGGSTSSFTMTMSPVNVISAVSANAYGSIGNSGGGSGVSDRGFCYSTSPAPTIANDTARAGSGSGTFYRRLTGLTAGATYYIRVYAIKNGVVYYSNQVSFTTFSLGLPGPGVGTVYDIEGNAYTTVTLGTQVWMLENLKTTRYRDGTPLTPITGDVDWVNATEGAWCDYANDPANGDSYGKLYNLYAIKDSRNLAPAGWHIPNYAEWITLLNYLGGGELAGGRMKETGLTHWLSPNFGADNSSGFTGLGAGGRNLFSINGAFSDLQTRANFWSSASRIEATGTYIHLIYLYHDAVAAGMTSMNTGLFATTFGASVRCIKD